MDHREMFVGRKVALDRSPNELLGTVSSFNKKVAWIRLKDGTTAPYGIKVLVAYKRR